MRLIPSTLIAVALTALAAVPLARSQEAATARAGTITVSAGWARATPPGAKVGAAYATVTNDGAAADRLVAVESGAAGTVELHETVEASGVATMRPLPEGVPVAAGGTVALKPGGLHIMLMELKEPLTAGATLPLTMRFETAGDVALEVPIEPVGAPGPTAEGAHMHRHAAPGG